jgi:hypothetical protein
LFSAICNAQSLVQSVNSGSVIGTNSSVSVGEIVVVPVNQNQSNSGLIGILTQINTQTLEVSEFEVGTNVIVYPNPTVSQLYFKSKEVLTNEIVSVFSNSGQLVLQTKINDVKAIDLSQLSSGIYVIQLSNKNFKSFKIIKH